MLKNWIILIIQWFPVVAIGVLVAIFLSRRLWRDLPFFFIYLVTALAVACFRYAAYLAGRQIHFYVYYISDWIGSIIVFFPLYEIFLRRVFAKFYRTLLYRKTFLGMALVILVLALLIAYQAHDKRAAFIMASRAFDFMRTAVLVFFMTLVLFMGRGWKRFDLGITLGFAIQAAIALADAAAEAKVFHRSPAVSTVEVAAYNISCLIWLITFSGSEKAETASPDQLNRETLQQAHTWESMLKTWLTPGKK